KEMDEKKRLALYHQINKLWIEDAAAAPLYQQLDLYGASKRITWKARSDERIKAGEMANKDGEKRDRAAGAAPCIARAHKSTTRWAANEHRWIAEADAIHETRVSRVSAPPWRSGP